MPVSNELFLAILSMDAYNRGYNSGIKVTGNQIGNATLGIAEDDTAAQAVSFFAQSYTLPDGQTVIAYRGTDQPTLAAQAFSLSPHAGRGAA
ncbi:MAG: hypothetical protein R3D62_15885 [Xanthobacteraceae bacterium]